MTFTYLDEVDETDPVFQMPDGTELVSAGENEETTLLWPLSLVLAGKTRMQIPAPQYDERKTLFGPVFVSRHEVEKGFGATIAILP